MPNEIWKLYETGSSGTNFTTIIDLKVTTTTSGERVRLSSMIETSIGTGNGTSYSFTLEYRIISDSSTPELTMVAYSETNIQKVTGSANASNISKPINLLCTDVPPGPGTYTYSAQIRRITPESTINTVTVGDRFIDAIVFPSA